MNQNQNQIIVDKKVFLLQNSYIWRRRCSPTLTKETSLHKMLEEGDFEGFATVGQHVGDNRAKYDTLHQEYEKFRAEFDTAVPDKKAFVKKLRSMNETELADAVASMFGVKESFFGKLFNK